MKRLVDDTGSITFGLYEDRIDEVNYKDYRLETPMGLPVPRAMSSALAKQFHFLGIIGPELIIGMAVIDLGYLGSGFAYIHDRRTGRMTEARKIQKGGRGAVIDPYPETGKSAFSSSSLSIEMERGRISARADDFEISAELALDQAKPLRICTRTGYRGWTYTQKTTPVPLTGSVSLHGEKIDLTSPSYMALTDWTCGFLRRETFWNWASTASTLPDGKTLGLNLSCGVNETSFTENAFWVDSARTKIDTVDFVFDRRDLMRVWRITSQDGKVNLTFHPEGRREEKMTAMLISSRFSQIVGVFDGTLHQDDGERIIVKNCPGFVEDHYAKW